MCFGCLGRAARHQGEGRSSSARPGTLPLPHPTPSCAKCVSPAQHSESQRRSIKALPKSKRNNNYNARFWVEDFFFFEGCGVLQNPGVIYF